MKVLIWDWHGTAKEKLAELGYESLSEDLIEMTQEQIFALSDHFTVMLRQAREERSKKGKLLKAKPDYDMLVAVTTYPNFNQR